MLLDGLYVDITLKSLANLHKKSELFRDEHRGKILVPRTRFERFFKIKEPMSKFSNISHPERVFPHKSCGRNS